MMYDIIQDSSGGVNRFKDQAKREGKYGEGVEFVKKILFFSMAYAFPCIRACLCGIFGCVYSDL